MPPSRPRAVPVAVVASIIVVLVLGALSVAIWNLVDTREPAPPVQLAP